MAALTEHDLRARGGEVPLWWRGVLIHHSATAATVSVRSITDYHVKERGWIAAGYHGFISLAPGGGYRFEPGRGLHLPGSHCPGKNRSHLGLCLIGNFSDAPPPQAQITVASEVLSEWCAALDISPEEIHPHRAFRQTECPGLVDIFALRRAVTLLLVGG